MYKKIYQMSEVDDLVDELDGQFRKDFAIYCTSGGFDPLHVGHLRCIKSTAEMCQKEFGVFVVIVNGDGFLHRKKGYAFMSHEERMEIVSSIEGVDYVLGWDDGSQFVTEAIRALKPSFFTKGGDRNKASNVPEFDLCKEIDCKVIFNVGGGKVQSSSELAQNAIDQIKNSPQFTL
jgi:cytidyltransferase-like protein